MRQIILSFLLFGCSASILTQPEIKGTPDEVRQIVYPHPTLVSLQGHAEEKAYADKAVVSLVVTTEEEKMAEAIARNTQIRADIKANLLQAGINSEDINTSKFSTTPEYGWFGKEPDQYKVINRIKIGVFSEKHLKIVAELADAHDEVGFAGAAYEHTEKEQFKQKVKKLALADVIRQKTFYEKSLGVKLIPHSFSDVRIAHRATRGAMLMGQMSMNVAAKREGIEVADSFAPQTKTPSSFDELTYEANVSVQYKIKPTK